MTTPEEEAFLEKKAEKRASRRQHTIEQGVLSITSLMDVVSIIVVYLLKNYGTDPVVISPTQGQKVPMSLADAPIQDGVPIYVSKRDLTFAARKVVQLDENGGIDPAALKGHSIVPLYELLAEEADKAKQMSAAKGEEKWIGRVILVGDQELKFSTLVDVMYTAGQAEFSEYVFCVIQKNS
jgi:hypothetical protein